MDSHLGSTSIDNTFWWFLKGNGIEVIVGSVNVIYYGGIIKFGICVIGRIVSIIT